MPSWKHEIGGKSYHGLAPNQTCNCTAQHFSMEETMEQPTVPVICSCGYDGKLTSPLCPLHGEHGLSAQVDRLRAVNAQLLEALEKLVGCIDTSAKDSLEGLGGNVAAGCHVIANTYQMVEARAAIEEAKK